MRIGEAAGALGVSTRSLRYYEDQGILHPGRTASGYRVYTDEDLVTARRIQQLLTAGLSTTLIKTLLPCLADHSGRLAPTCPETLGELRRERRRIDGAIESLAASREAIDEVITAGTEAASAR